MHTAMECNVFTPRKMLVPEPVAYTSLLKMTKLPSPLEGFLVIIFHETRTSGMIVLAFFKRDIYLLLMFFPETLQDFHHLPETRGLCLAEEQIIRSVRFFE